MIFRNYLGVPTTLSKYPSAVGENDDKVVTSIRDSYLHLEIKLREMTMLQSMSYPIGDFPSPLLL